MSTTRTVLTTLVISILSLFALATAQSEPRSEALRSITYDVASAADIDVHGTVFIGDYGPDVTTVVVSLQGTIPGGNHPAHFHVGDCGSGNAIAVPLSNVNGFSGVSVTLVEASFDRIVGADFYLNVHRSPRNLGTILACGEIGAGTEPLRVRGDVPTSTTMDASGPADPGDWVTPATASYGLFRVDGSGIRGGIQMTDEVEDGTRFVVTLIGIEEGQTYPVAIHEGDCGPDQPRVSELNALGHLPGDPYVSITETTLAFETIRTGKYFMTVFESPARENIVACGEIGDGANR